jgi:hypothetical protein
MDQNGYFSCAETAKLVRKALKDKFPGQKFSVRSDTYSGGASIRVRWTGGPTVENVKAVTEPFEGGGFDASIDLKYHVYSWLLPDGTVQFARSSGTEGSRGTVPAYDHVKPHPDAQLVSFAADYIFVDRDPTPGRPPVHNCSDHQVHGGWGAGWVCGFCRLYAEPQVSERPEFPVYADSQGGEHAEF